MYAATRKITEDNNEKVRIAQKQWFDINAPFGKRLGYPDCCIKEFCDQPPSVLEMRGTNNNDTIRYDMSFINGIYSGFIPCLNHAKQIKNGTITLKSLIQNRDDNFPEFPNL